MKEESIQLDPFAPYLKSAYVEFYNPSFEGSDDKDHDTAVDINIFGTDGHLITALNTRYDKDEKFEDNGSTHIVPLQFDPEVVKISYRLIEYCTFVITIHPHQSDTWTFKPGVVFKLEDGQVFVLKRQPDDIVKLRKTT